jgi:hypothetical protein
MLRRLGRSSLDNDAFGSEDANPMSGVSNLADAMLVLAVGIMMALIINWQIDINSDATTTQVQQDNLQEVSDYDTLDSDDLTVENGLGGLKEAGTVYVDPETGTIYMLVDED